MFEGPLLPWQQIYYLAFHSIFRTTPEVLKFLVNFTLLKYVKSQRSYGFLITKELIFGFQILDLKDHFSASLSLSKIVGGGGGGGGGTQHRCIFLFCKIV